MSKAKEGLEILVIGDAHATPQANNDRFEWLGNFIVEKQPDVIVNIGDMASMDSLSAYDKGSVFAEGRRYTDDIEVTIDAQKRMAKPIAEYNAYRTKKKHLKKYAPKMVLTLGNHENRINRAANELPSMYEHIKVADLHYEKYGWKVMPFLSPYIVEDIAFSHYATSGVMGRPISGDNAAANLVKKGFHSTVVGHSHMRGYFETTNIAGKRIFGLVAGCYYEHEDHYTTEGHRNWRGLVMLHEAQEGYCEPAWYSMNYIKEKYS